MSSFSDMPLVPAKRAQWTENEFATDPELEYGAGDETRTRDFNLGKKMRGFVFEAAS